MSLILIYVMKTHLETQRWLDWIRVETDRERSVVTDTDRHSATVEKIFPDHVAPHALVSISSHKW